MTGSFVHIQMQDAATGLLTVLAGVPRGWSQCSENLPLPALEPAVHSPAAYGTPVCRFHGARRPETVSRGPSHPQYRHGRETLDAKRGRVEAMTRIRALADLGVAGGFLTKWISGRRPNTAKTRCPTP